MLCLSSCGTDKGAFDGLKWTNEKKSTDGSNTGTGDEKTGENGGDCFDTGVAAADQNITGAKEKV